MSQLYERIPLLLLEDFVSDVQPREQDERGFRAMIIVLAPASIATTEAPAIAAWTGYDLPFVETCVGNLRANGIFAGDSLTVDIFADTTGLTLTMVACVATGFMTYNGAGGFALTELGKQHVEHMTGVHHG